MATAAVIQRPLRGSRISSFYPVKNLPPLSSLDSAFQLQEYISLLIRLDVHDVDTIVAVPGQTKHDSPKEEGEDKERKVDVDEACWIYEQLRRLAQDLTHPLITALQEDCSRATCPEMKAGEWLYLCVAHGNDGAMEQCCAIDYILHTLDSATALLNSPRAFPSRLQIPQTSHRHFSALARRLGRIFSHAYFHHRSLFDQAEAESSLYARFIALTSRYELVPADFLVIPPRLDEPPRLMGAGLEPYHSEGEDFESPVEEEGDADHWPVASSHSTESGVKNSSPPGLGSGGESPRKVGRNRTDTMVFSEAFNAGVLEELAKANSDEPATDGGNNASDPPAASDSAELEPENPPEPVPTPSDNDVPPAALAEEDITTAIEQVAAEDRPKPTVVAEPVLPAPNAEEASDDGKPEVEGVSSSPDTKPDAEKPSNASSDESDVSETKEVEEPAEKKILEPTKPETAALVDETPVDKDTPQQTTEPDVEAAPESHSSAPASATEAEALEPELAATAEETEIPSKDEETQKPVEAAEVQETTTGTTDTTKAA